MSGGCPTAIGLAEGVFDDRHEWTQSSLGNAIRVPKHDCE